MVPSTILSNILSILHLSLLYSLYSFEYKWCNMGMELNSRLSIIENCWPYFLGFGLPLAVVTSLPESYIIRYNSSLNDLVFYLTLFFLFPVVVCFQFYFPCSLSVLMKSVHLKLKYLGGSSFYKYEIVDYCQMLLILFLYFKIETICTSSIHN